MHCTSVAPVRERLDRSRQKERKCTGVCLCKKDCTQNERQLKIKQETVMASEERNPFRTQVENAKRCRCVVNKDSIKKFPLLGSQANCTICPPVVDCWLPMALLMVLTRLQSPLPDPFPNTSFTRLYSGRLMDAVYSSALFCWGNSNETIASALPLPSTVMAL